MAETGGTEIQETVEIGTEIGVEALELVHTVVLGDGVRDAVGTDEDVHLSQMRMWSDPASLRNKVSENGRM